jgi:hypothetical protein
MCSPDVAITYEIASTTGAASATCESAPKWDPVAELVSGAKVRARRCSIRSQSERRTRNSAIFWRQIAERYDPTPICPGFCPYYVAIHTSPTGPSPGVAVGNRVTPAPPHRSRRAVE